MHTIKPLFLLVVFFSLCVLAFVTVDKSQIHDLRTKNKTLTEKLTEAELVASNATKEVTIFQNATRERYKAQNKKIYDTLIILIPEKGDIITKAFDSTKNIEVRTADTSVIDAVDAIKVD